MAFLELKRRNGRVCAHGLHRYEHRARRGGGPMEPFVRWRWDGTVLEAENCRYGLIPLYYACVDDGICVSPFIGRLLERGVSADLDERAVAVFLRLGWFIGEDTLYKAIRCLPPNARLTWSGDLRLERRSMPIRPVALERGAAVRRYAALFREAMEARVTGDYVLPLSGGRDSRHILFEACRIRRPIECVTLRRIDGPPSHDIALAKRLARALRLRHMIIEPREEEIVLERKKNAMIESMALEHGWLVPMVEHLGAKRTTIFDGIAGDVLSAALYADRKSVDLARLRDVDAWAERILGFWNFRGADLYAMPPAFGPDVAREHLKGELSEHLDRPNPVQSFYFWNRTRRGTGLYTYRMLAGHDVVAPYLDEALFTFLCGLDPSVADRRFHDDAIAHAFPEHRHIPYTLDPLTRRIARRIAREVGSLWRRDGKGAPQVSSPDLRIGEWLTRMKLVPS